MRTLIDTSLPVTRVLDSDTITRVQHPHRLVLARMGWWLALIWTLFIFLSNLSYFYANTSQICESPCHTFGLSPAIAEQLEAANLPLRFWGQHIAFLDCLMIAIYIGVALLIFLRRSDDWMALLATSTLMMLCVNTTISNTYSPFDDSPLRLLAQAHTVVGLYLTIRFVSVFPNGRYAFGWMRLIVYGAVAWEISRRAFIGNIISSETGFSLRLYLMTYIFLGLALAPQIYRYRHSFTPSQKQQTKWIVLGSALTFVGSVTSAVLYFMIVPQLSLESNALFWNLFFRALYYLSLVPLPFGIAFSVFRYRLWEADLAINRSLVYALITGVLLLVFGLSFSLFQWLVRAFIGQDFEWIASLLATGMIAATFRPVSQHVRHEVDQRIFGLRADLGELARLQQQRQAIKAGAKGALSGTVLGNYQVDSLIGKGGMGQVYQAHHPSQTDPFAVKVLADMFSRESEHITRFQREAQIAQTLIHTNIVPVLDFGISPTGVHYLVMPYVAGQNLHELLKSDGAFSVERLYPIVKDIAAALDFLHQAGYVHRDIKPSNIIVQPDGCARLTDFGLAKMTDNQDAVTSTGIMGTLDYISPEQITNDHAISPRSDLYSFGVLCYQMLTGRLPFEGGIGQLVFAHLNQPPPDAQVLRPDLSPSVACALMQMMQKSPDARYPSAHAFVEAWA